MRQNMFSKVINNQLWTSFCTCYLILLFTQTLHRVSNVQITVIIILNVYICLTLFDVSVLHLARMLPMGPSIPGAKGTCIPKNPFFLLPDLTLETGCRMTCKIPALTQASSAGWPHCQRAKRELFADVVRVQTRGLRSEHACKWDHRRPGQIGTG